MEERRGAVTFQGSAVTLLGKELTVGDRAPDFRVVDGTLADVTLADFRGKVKIICTVPSLDTPVCSNEVRRFNREAEQFGDELAVLVVSLDLPFAQNRWCASKGVERVRLLSDYRDKSFGLAYGVLVRELQLLARAVFVLDTDDTLRHIEVVEDIGDEPDYGAAIAAAKGVLVPVTPLPMDGICGAY